MAQLPASVTIVQLPLGTTVTGAELIEAVQTSASGQANSVQLSLTKIFAALTVPIAVPTIRLPVYSATIAILNSDIEVGISTVTGAVTVNLPSAAAWAAASPGGAAGLDLLIIDATGNAGAHNITFGLHGADTVLQGALPAIAGNYGSIRLRPFGTQVSNTPIVGWLVKGVG